MDIHEIKVLLAVHIGNEELVLKNAGGTKLVDDYFVVTNDGSCYLFDANGIEKDISAITMLFEDIVSKDIKKIIISNSVMSIGDFTFYCCDGLTKVMIPDSVTSIGNYAFYYCSSLTSVTIPNSVINIGKWAFAGCDGLMSVTIPNSVTDIGHHAFYKCSGLTSMMIPDGVIYIGENAFHGCSELTSMIFKGKTLEEVQLMKNYPFGIKDKSFITCIDEMHVAA